MVVDGWIVLQVAHRIDLSGAGEDGAAAIAGTSASSVDLKLAQNEGSWLLPDHDRHLDAPSCVLCWLTGDSVSQQNKVH